MPKPRTHPRLTVEFEVTVRAADGAFVTRTHQIGGGGMALSGAAGLQIAQPVELQFQLPEGPAISIPAIVWWKEKGLVGVRFDVSSAQRDVIERWVRERLEDASYFAKPI